MASAEELNEVITELTNDHWSKFHTPYLLSQLGPELVSKNIDYKQIMSPLRMKQYIHVEMDSVSVVTHPIHRQKTGIIPAGESFEYPAEENDSDELDWQIPSEAPKDFFEIKNYSEKKAREFFSLLDGLSADELNQIQIPLKILARIVSK